MADVRIDATLELDGTPPQTRFFRGPVTVTFRWDMNGSRVADGPRLLTQVFAGLPASFHDGIDAAVIERGDKALLFKNDKYCRVDLAARTAEAERSILTDFGLPSAFVDTALAGRGAYAGKTYFFHGPRYFKVGASGVEEPRIRDIEAGWHLPAPFSSGVDAATNGFLFTANTAAFFRFDRYLSYDWTNDRVIGSVTRIVDGWPGVAEMLQAGLATVEALRWVRAARVALGTSGTPTDATTLAALTAHFKSGAVAQLPTIRRSFETIERLLLAMPERYRFRDLDEAVADRGVGADDPANPRPARDRVVPAYQSGGIVSFTPVFVGQLPRSQAAMVIHEMVHTFDGASGNANTHISEWYTTVSPRLTPAVFATTYTAQPTAHAIHNPSAYAAFAQHVFFGIDTRFGAGRNARNDATEDPTRPFSNFF